MAIDAINDQIKQTLMGHLGMVFTQVSANYIEATMPVDQRTCQPFGILHGGATIALAESIGGLGSIYLCQPEQTCVGLQISANHISSAKEGDQVCGKGTLIHQGRSTHIWNVDVFSVQSGKLISSIRVTNSILNKK